ncbi:MAG TPA: hypothetical protein VES97_01560 [Solirubrobacteraceae bacterium]|nr:hypothetical protein [Solirubrobacteraceae bacterium]
MPQIDSNGSRPATAVLLLVLASLSLAACGGSSKSSSTSTKAAATTSTTRAAGPKTGHIGRGTRINSPQFKQALERFATCMRENGVKVPAPNSSGNGPIFNIKGLDPNSPQFRAAERKCSAKLRAAFRRARPGAPAAPSSPAG